MNRTVARVVVLGTVGMLAAATALAEDMPAAPPPASTAGAPAAPPAAAPAAPAPTAKPASPKKLLADADKAFKKKDVAGARALYQRAFDAAPSPAAALGVAKCERAAGHLAGALGRYEDLVAKRAKELKPAQTKEANKAIAELRDLTGAVAVTSPSADATVLVDGSAAGRTPLSGPVRLDPGPHVVELRAEGRKPARRDVTIVAKTTEALEVKLEIDHPPAKLTVSEGATAGAHVLVDGVDVGTVPWSGLVPPGEHQIEIRAEGFVAMRQSFTFGDAEQREIVATLAKVPPPAPPPPVVAAAPAPAPDAKDQATKPEQAPEERSKGHGLYLDFDVFAGYPTRVPGYGCAPGGVCTSTLALPSSSLPAPSAPGLVARIGYRPSWWGIEVVGAGLGDIFVQRNKYVPTGSPTPNATSLDDTFAREEDFLRYGYGAFVGVGGRATLDLPVIDLTAGLALGGTWRQVHLTRSISGAVDDSYSGSSGYVAPAMMADAGLRISILRVGVMARADFASDQSTSPNASSTVQSGGKSYAYGTPAFALTTGPQLFFGPFAGLQFGG